MNDQPMRSRRPEQSLDFSEAEWRAWMLFQNWKRTSLTNELRFIAWLSSSIALMALGFVVRRLEYITSAAHRGGPLGASAHALFSLWIPALFMLLAASVLLVGTVEFLVDRRRINSGNTRSGPAMDILVVSAMLIVLLLAALLLL